MGNQVAIRDESTDISSPSVTFNEDQVALIKRTVAEGATDDELKLFLYQAKRTGLDPLSRQIHFVKRKGKGTIQTAIDGYRLIADRTGQYAGSDDYRFDDGLTQYEHIQGGKGHPVTATVTVYKIVAGHRVPFTATGAWSEYYPGDGKQSFMWRKMPYLMLGKCVEALALRKAFPAELSGLYTDEEMAQAGASMQPPPMAPSGNGDPSKNGNGKDEGAPEDPPAEFYDRASGQAIPAAAVKAYTDGGRKVSYHANDDTVLPKCPVCEGEMWDNRETKRNPRAPDFKCMDKPCGSEDGVLWPGEWPPTPEVEDLDQRLAEAEQEVREMQDTRDLSDLREEASEAVRQEDVS